MLIGIAIIKPFKLDVIHSMRNLIEKTSRAQANMACGTLPSKSTNFVDYTPAIFTVDFWLVFPCSNIANELKMRSIIKAL